VECPPVWMASIMLTGVKCDRKKIKIIYIQENNCYVRVEVFMMVKGRMTLF
jgi:hypothetical protein